MAVHLLTVYPYAYFNNKGEFQRVSVYTWQPYGDELKNGGSVSDDGYITVHLPSMQVSVIAPDLSVIEAKAVALLRIHKDKIREEHTKLLTRMQFAENNLLRIAAPEVLDAGDGPVAKAINLDDDIPF